MFDSEVRAIITKLQTITLKPSDELNAIFGTLVGMAIAPENDTLFESSTLAQEEVQSLRDICSKGEFELELHWARQIIASQYPSVSLMQFPYYENYRKLAAMEIMSLKGLSGVYPKRMLVIGGGPLPLSGLIAFEEYGVATDFIDNNEDAVNTANELIKALKHNGEAVVADAFTFDGYGNYDVILVAALVGADAKQKKRLLQHIAKQLSGATAVVVRSADGARQLLYPGFTAEMLPGSFEQQVYVMPKNDVVNSFLIAIHRVVSRTVEVTKITTPAQSKVFRQKALDYIHDVYGYPYKPEWHHDLDRSFEVYTKPRAAHWLVSLNGEVIGTVAVRASLTSEDTAELWRFFIDKRYSEIVDVSSTVWPEIQKFLKSNGYTTVVVHDQKHVPGAIAHYLKLGFTVTHDPKDIYKTVYMEKLL